MSQDLQQARYDQLVRRVGALYGGGSKVTEVLSELFPVLEVENTTPELIALSGWRTAWQSSERTSAVGQVSTSQLFNPAGSNIIAVVTHIEVALSPATALQVETQDTVLVAGAVSGLYRDTRFGVPRSTALQLRSVDGSPVGGGLRYRLADGENLQIHDDNGIAVLTPGFGLAVGTVGTQNRLGVNYFWRERLAQSAELLFP